jgi:hypothetical protein
LRGLKINNIMLKENRIGQVISFKTTSGDEVVGKVTGQTAEELTVAYPVILAASPQGLGMVPFLMTASPELEVAFKMSHVVCIAPTNQQVADAYTQQTTGIVAVRNPGIITG